MIGVDEDLDWGGLLDDSDSDNGEVGTDITADGSIRFSGRGITDISPEGSEEDSSEAYHREATLKESKSSEALDNKSRFQKELMESGKRQLRSHNTVDNIDTSTLDDRHGSTGKINRTKRGKPNAPILHSVSVPPENVDFVALSRNSTPQSNIRKVGIAPDNRETTTVESFGPQHERRNMSPSSSLARVAPDITNVSVEPSRRKIKNDEIRSPTAIDSPPVEPPGGNHSRLNTAIADHAAAEVPNGVGGGKLWNQLSFRLKPQFANFTEVNSFANAIRVLPSAEGARVLCGTADSTVRMIDATSGRVLGMFEGHSDRVLAVAVSEYVPTGKHGEAKPQVVVAGSRDEMVCIWDLKSARCKHILSNHEGAVWAVGVSTEVARPVAVSGSSDCSIRSWDIETGEEVCVFRGHSDTVLALAIHAGSDNTRDPPRVVSGGADHMVRIWDLVTGRHCRMLEGHTDDVNAISIVVDPSGTVFNGVKIVSGSRDRSVRVWDMERGMQLAEFHGHSDCIYGVVGVVGKFASLQSSSPGETEMVAKGSKAGVGELNKQSSAWIRSDEGGLKRDSNASFVVASCGEDRTVRMWNVLEERQMAVSKKHKGSVKGISVLPVKMVTTDGIVGSAMLMATCSWDKSVMFYDFDNLLMENEKEGCCTLS